MAERGQLAEWRRLEWVSVFFQDSMKCTIPDTKTDAERRNNQSNNNNNFRPGSQNGGNRGGQSNLWSGGGGATSEKSNPGW